MMKIETQMSPQVRTRVQIQLEGNINSEFVTFKNLSDPAEHVAIVLGNPKEVPLVRIHSECLTGDIFGSQRCDCGPQLQESVRKINVTGGVLLYLRQEGRGIGLYNKLDAYKLQDKGYSTFEANNMLNFADDLRSFKVAAEMLFALGMPEITLLSNNPDKRAQLESFGIEVLEQMSTDLHLTRFNRQYLISKACNAGHTLNISGAQL